MAVKGALLLERSGEPHRLAVRLRQAASGPGATVLVLDPPTAGRQS